MFIDLHTHTTCSDGTVTPEDLVMYAREKRLKAVAVTDHDTVAGNERALVAGEPLGVYVVPGVEFSAEYDGTLHVLGLFVDSTHRAMKNATEMLQKKRKERNVKVIEKLRAQGIDIPKERYEKNAYLGRPHIASEIVKAGCARTIEDAFERFLRKGAPCYVKRERLFPEDTVRTIVEAGGIAVLAHPVTIPDPEKTLRELLEYGLRGIEVYYPTHSPEDMAQFRGYAQKYGLFVTGGSDFHGEHKPDIDLGCMNVPAELLDVLLE